MRAERVADSGGREAGRSLLRHASGGGVASLCGAAAAAELQPGARFEYWLESGPKGRGWYAGTVAEKNQEAGWWGARFDDARRRGFCVLMTAANYGTAWRSTTAPPPAGAELLEEEQLRSAFAPASASFSPGSSAAALKARPLAPRHAKLLGGDLLLVTGGPAKTIKFYFGLALGLQPLSTGWARRCLAKGCYLRPSAADEALRLPPLLPACSLLAGRTIVPVGDDGWVANCAPLLAAAGADVQTELPRVHHSASGAAAAPCVVIADTLEEAAPLFARARARRLPVADLRWLKTMLMRQRTEADRIAWASVCACIQYSHSSLKSLILFACARRPLPPPPSLRARMRSR
ncbi:hypothetical protein EMIHUDRAFT_457127 [Emiliania huxleyi CCMP1516]|uniref:BRCT domain-containing protein n=2 Tax=Emiliania huxleyi TaxID=2903 RepID=A0A0D3JVP5_EMIH1|nr:hypothetical protein EMIHUDRAFT_457127 [Emiliania huxleyi CCMP1516]EOD27580.1 hypothetical protein EMIHUDRAFT_457127 [Emiliania huxleyi CCMP1516]|eukprot:XP_005780009.1 hypothetical protein EMIHUDRAFT_457127 [Emiliania huxleyi CCMP1516]